MLPGGHQDVRCASRIDLSTAFARPRQPIVVDGQADVGRPLFALVRALRDNPPAGFGTLLVLENAERLPGPSPLITYDRRQQALSEVSRRAGAHCLTRNVTGQIPPMSRRASPNRVGGADG